MLFSTQNLSNGIFLRSSNSGVSVLSRHRGYHSVYNKFVKAELNKLDINLSVNDLTSNVQSLQGNLRKLHESGLPMYSENKFSNAAMTDLWKRSLARVSG